MIVDVLYAVWYRDARQTAAALESRRSDIDHAVRNRDTRQAAAAFESKRSDLGYAVWDRDARQAAAVSESRRSDIDHAVWDRDARQAAAVMESTDANTGHAVWDRDARQAAAVLESTVANTGHTVWNTDTRQVATTKESIVADAGYIFSDNDRIDCVAVAIPGRTIAHRPIPADGQQSVITQRPGDAAIRTAGDLRQGGAAEEHGRGKYGGNKSPFQRFLHTLRPSPVMTKRAERHPSACLRSGAAGGHINHPPCLCVLWVGGVSCSR